MSKKQVFDFALSPPHLAKGLVSLLRGNRGGARVNFPDPLRISAYAGALLQMRGATITEVFDACRLVEPEAAARIAGLGDIAVLSALAQNAAAQRFLIGDRIAFQRAARSVSVANRRHRSALGRPRYSEDRRRGFGAALPA